ncbi:MAG: flagellar hook-length control protein FliK [Thiobacillus sp.]|nr:flagellar hook-length control protein FliK [Thiobacillus sp.]
MLPTEVLTRILAVQPVLDAVGRDKAAPRTPFEHLLIGQAVTGQVKGQSKGLTLVSIEGQTVAMRLPHPVATGDTLKLVFAGHMPQPVFLLDTPDTAATDTPQLSQTARMLSEIMQRVPERTLPTLTPLAPLLEQPASNPAELALALRTALVRSGLFYESHLANWAVGLDSLDGLMQEPQNRMPGKTARADATPVLASMLAAAAPLTDASNPGQLADAKSANPIHTLLTQQLQVLESSQFIWRGELWPGHKLEWQVGQEPDPPHDPAKPDSSETGMAWESRLKISLPQLGTLNVHIKLDARQAFSIRLVPDQAEVGALLQQNQARLIEQFTTAGCALHSVMVQNDDDAG